MTTATQTYEAGAWWSLQALRARNVLWFDMVLACGVLFAASLLLAYVDPRTLFDVSIWAKPAKFHISTLIYFATLLLCARLLPIGFARTFRGRALTLLTVITAVFELAYISSQAALGEASHFNFSSSFHISMYSLMGVGATLLVLGSGWLGIEIARARGVGEPLVLAVVLGLIMTVILGGGFGGVLSSNGGHWVGVCRSDANGLSLLGWSNQCGDLRVAHFWGMHAMQAVPIFAWLLSRLRVVSNASQWQAVWVFALLYAALGLALFFQALAGEPLLG